MMGLERFLEESYNQALLKQSNRSAASIAEDHQTEHTKQALQQCLGSYAELKGAIRVELLHTALFNTFIREKVLLHIDGYLALPLYILTPLKVDGKLPAVLALHGHGYGNNEIVGLTETGQEDHGETIHKHFAVKLVERGLKVFAPEIIGFGQRMLDVDRDAGKRSSCYRLATHLLLNGRTLAGLRIAEALRVVDFIETLDDVDSRRIGIMGFSGGGLLAAYAAVLDQRFKATVLCGFTSTFKESILDREHCIDNYIPGILQIGELPDIIGQIAPRRLFIESGIEDTVFPITGVKHAVEQLQQIYTAIGAQAALQVDFFHGVHEINGRQVYDWLKKSLLD